MSRILSRSYLLSQPRRLLLPLALALLGALFAVLVFGADLLRPTSISWLMHGDRAQSFLGWHFFRHTPFTPRLPLGQIPSLLYPIGSSLAYSDSIPWFSLVARVASPLMPPTAQISGTWLVLCFALQGLFGFLLLKQCTDDPYASFIGTILFIAAPSLLARKGHFSLCAHWLILASLFLSLRRPRSLTTANFLLSRSVLVILASGTHPYLSVMILTLSMADAVERMRGIQRLLVSVLTLTFVQVVGWYTFGYLAQESAQAAGFGSYSMNALALLDPGDQSSLLVDLPNGPEQYEGFAFLGAGALLTILFALFFRCTFSRSPSSPSASRVRVPYPLAITCIAMALFALSDRVWFGPYLLFDVSALYPLPGFITDTFRASGRFSWPLCYLLMALAVAKVSQYAAGHTAALRLALTASVAFQLLDSFGYYSRQNVVWMALLNNWDILRDPSWQSLDASYDEISLVPPYIHDVDCMDQNYKPYYYIPFAYLAGMQNLRINSGHSSRPSTAEIRAYCDRLADEIREGRLRERVLYIVDPPYLKHFEGRGQNWCRVTDGLNLCALRSHS